MPADIILPGENLLSFTETVWEVLPNLSRFYIGELAISGVVRQVAIKVKQTSRVPAINPEPGLLRIIDETPFFLRHHLGFMYGGEVYLVTDLATSNLCEVPRVPTILQRIAPFEIVKQCLECLYHLHRSGYSYGQLYASKFVLQTAGDRFFVVLTDFTRSTALVDLPDPVGTKTAEVVRLGEILDDLLGRLVPAPEDFRSLMLGHVVGELSTSVRDNYRLSQLRTHPALQPECKLLSFVCDVSVEIEVESKECRGRPLIKSLFRQGGHRYRDWREKFPVDLRGIYFRHHSEPPARFLGFVDYDYRDSLAWVVRVYRNKSVHYCDFGILSQHLIGEHPIFYVRNWGWRLRHLYVDVWLAVIDAGLQSKFPCFFDLQ